MTGKYLITTDNWFYAPDGQNYKAAWGDVKIVEDTILGIKTNRQSSNWFARVGTDENHILIAGCQIHYAVRCEERPNTGDVDDWSSDAVHVTSNDYVKTYKRPSSIYIPE